MINIRFEEREKIGLQYALETLHGCSPFGQEKIRKLRYYSPDEREELETELYNVEQAAKAADALKPLYDRIGLMLCQMKDIRGSLRRCQALEIPDHVELFEIKVYLQRLESLIPLFRQVCETTHFKALAFHDPAQALETPPKNPAQGERAGRRAAALCQSSVMPPMSLTTLPQRSVSARTSSSNFAPARPVAS